MVRFKKVLGQDIYREDVDFGCSKIRSEARGGPPLPRAPGIARGFIGSKPSRCTFYGRAYGRGGWLPPSPGLSSQKVFRNGRGFHLAEYALALHLPLQHLKGLVDIVVADENLHAVFLLDRAVNGPDGQGARATGTIAQFWCR